MIIDEMNTVPEVSLSENTLPGSDAEDTENNTPFSDAQDAEENTADQPTEDNAENTAEKDETEADTDEEVEEEAEQPPKPDYLTLTLESHVLPLEMRFSQINHCYRRTPFAYRSYTYINSVIDGIISPERYSFAADQTDQGIRLSRWNVSEAVAAIKKFSEAGRKVDFVTARVSPKIVDQLDFYAYIKDLADGCGLEDYSKLCLEFPRTVLFEDHEKVRAAVLAMKLLKMRSMMSGCGEKDSALTPLFDIPFDYLILAPALAYKLTDRSKKSAMESLLSFMRLLGCDVICENIVNDDQISVLVRADCVGYIPSPEYQGSTDHGRLRMPLDEAVMQNGGEDEEDF